MATDGYTPKTPALRMRGAFTETARPYYVYSHRESYLDRPSRAQTRKVAPAHQGGKYVHRSGLGSGSIGGFDEIAILDI